MLTTTVNFPTRRAPSPQIRARDTSLDGTTNGSAGVNSAPDVDAGVNGATHLSGQRCRDHEYRGDNTNYRKLAEHNLSLPWAQITELRLGRVYQLVRVSEDDLILEPFTGQLPPWQRRTNAWRKATNPRAGAKRLRSANDGYGDEKMCPMCHGKLGLGVRSRNVWNGRWWVHVRYCSTHCEALHELERYDASAKRKSSSDAVPGG